jgi:hypothetical protein
MPSPLQPRDHSTTNVPAASSVLYGDATAFSIGLMGVNPGDDLIRRQVETFARRDSLRCRIDEHETAMVVDRAQV